MEDEEVENDDDDDDVSVFKFQTYSYNEEDEEEMPMMAPRVSSQVQDENLSTTRKPWPKQQKCNKFMMF